MNKPGSGTLASFFANSQVLTVSELTNKISGKLEGEFSSLKVRGEISNYLKHPSGHIYFSLKDSGAQIRVAYFKNFNRLLRFEPEDGLEVQIRGKLQVYKERGEYQIAVETMEPVGIGQLQLAYDQLFKRLSSEGLFEQSRKRPLPKYPHRIGIVTSSTGAVIQDMLQILERRNRAINVIIVPVKVQGTGASDEIAEAVKLLNRYSTTPGCEIDVIIVGRGGGSIEDLWAFNEELVARAVFESKIPVVSAVGHETDTTIIDHVADRRAPTPSAAAEIISAHAADLKDLIGNIQSKLNGSMELHLLRRRNTFQTFLAKLTLTDRVKSARLKFNSLKHKLETADFKASITISSSRLELMRKRISNAGTRKLERNKHRYEVSLSKLNMLSPLSVLKRGYTLVKDDDGHLVSSVRSVNPDAELIIHFTDGEIRVKVI